MGAGGMRTMLAMTQETDSAQAAAASVSFARDAGLLARSAKGDAKAFREIVALHLPICLAIARRVLRDNAEAEDVAQDALVRLWRNAATLELGPGGLRPWLRRVVFNLSIDRTRSSRRTSVVEDVPEAAEPASQLRQISERELSARVQKALDGLPERQRVALTLFHFEGLSQSEIAATLEISDEAVESLLARARRALKSELKDEWRQFLPDVEGTP